MAATEYATVCYDTIRLKWKTGFRDKYRERGLYYIVPPNSRDIYLTYFIIEKVFQQYFAYFVLLAWTKILLAFSYFIIYLTFEGLNAMLWQPPTHQRNRLVYKTITYTYSKHLKQFISRSILPSTDFRRCLTPSFKQTICMSFPFLLLYNT